MHSYTLAPAVITSMLLSLITILFTFADEPQLVLPLVHVSGIVCIGVVLYCLFLHSL